MTVLTDIDGILACLAREREALDQLWFKLEEERLLLAAGQHRFLGQASGEIERAIAGLDAVSRKRTALLAEAAAMLGLPAPATLRHVAEAMPSSDAGRRLLAMRQELRASLEQVRASAGANRQLLARGLAATADALSLLGAPPSYDESGGTLAPARQAMLLDARA